MHCVYTHVYSAYMRTDMAMDTQTSETLVMRHIAPRLQTMAALAARCASDTAAHVSPGVPGAAADTGEAVLAALGPTAFTPVAMLLLAWAYGFLAGCCWSTASLPTV